MTHIGQPIGLLLILTGTVDVEYTEVVRLSVVLDKTFSASVALNKSPSFSQKLSKTVALTTYVELEDNS